MINEARWDRALRLIVGLGMLYLGWAGVVVGFWGLSFKLFGLFPLLSGILGWDPIYQLVGFRTIRSRSSKPTLGEQRPAQE